MASIVIKDTFCGPPGTGNGGYVCGRLAQFIPSAGSGSATRITLRRPVPLNTELAVAFDEPGSVVLRRADVLIAQGASASVDRNATPPFVSFAEAVAAEARTPYPPEAHLLPDCFVCGPARNPGDGLCLSAGPVDVGAADLGAADVDAGGFDPNDSGRVDTIPIASQREDSGPAYSGPEDSVSVDSGSAKRVGATSLGPLFAVSWVPHERFAMEDGEVAEEFIWSALDCPSGYATGAESQLLGQMTAVLYARPRTGEQCVISARQMHKEGRKRFASAALYRETGELLAFAENIWITVSPEVFVSS